MKKSILIIVFMAIGIQGVTKAQTVTNYKPVSINYVDLSDGATVTAQPIHSKQLSIKSSKASESVIEIKLNEIIHSNLSGIGGAFNEQGGEAFMSLDEKDQKILAKNIFSVNNGIGFSMCRTAVGSSDFGLGAYSYSEIPEDYEMKYFSVERDKASVLPFINAAQTQNPELKIFASPWSPPGWMKESGKMDDGAVRKEATSGERMTWVNNGKNYLRDETKIYEAYALYFRKYVQAYAQQGVTIERLAIQNETDMNTIYPSCDMSPEQMEKLAFKYIQPAFDSAGLKTEVWAGTFRGKRDDAEAFIALEGASKIDGIAMQYASAHQVREVCEAGYSVMHTEGKCYNSKNTMEQARSRFREVRMWLNSGAENYCYWNMVLNEESTSGWGWKQNSMIKIDKQTKIITYNPDYAPMALFSKFIRPGDQSIKTTTSGNVVALAVRNEKHLVLFLQNDTDAIAKQNIKIIDKNFTVEIPAKSLSAFVFKPEI
jgi:glucosylceramidase